jgi:phosphatidate cytidylyltransferase
MLKQRVLTVIAVLPLFLAALFFLPNSWWSLLMALLLLGGGIEWSRLAQFSNVLRAGFLLLLMAGCIVFDSNMGASVDERLAYLLSLAFWCVVAPCWLAMQWRSRQSLLWLITGLIVLLPTWLALVRLQPEPQLLLTLLGVIWVSDTAAYFTGRRFGRRKLAPAISPGKTWEGVAGALVAVAVYAWIIQLTVLPRYDMNFIGGAFLTMAIFGIIGDLFESWLKRVAGVKDSGRLLPGHGGILDRLDSLTAALPLAALLLARPA